MESRVEQWWNNCRLPPSIQHICHFYSTPPSSCQIKFEKSTQPPYYQFMKPHRLVGGSLRCILYLFIYLFSGKNKQKPTVCKEWLENVCAQACACVRACVRACITGQAPWKQQQRSSAFKWIKTPAQSPEPAGIGQTGCSLDEDLRLIISHAAFVFAATVASMGRARPCRPSGSGGQAGSRRYHLARPPTLWRCCCSGRPQGSNRVPADSLCLVCRETLFWPGTIHCVQLTRLVMWQHQIYRVNISLLQLLGTVKTFGISQRANRLGVSHSYIC